MIDKQFLESLTSRISQLFPHAAELGEEGRDALRQALHKSLAELNVLTQEQFEARDRALKRAEQRVDELEQQIQILEQKITRLQENGQGGQ